MDANHVSIELLVTWNYKIISGYSIAYLHDIIIIIIIVDNQQSIINYIKSLINKYDLMHNYYLDKTK